MTVVHVLSLSAIGGVQNSFIPYIELAKLKSKLNHEICLTRRLGDDFSESNLGDYYMLKSIKGLFRLIYQIISKNFIIHFYNSLGSKSIYNLLRFLPTSNIIFHERGSAWNSNSFNYKYFVKNANISDCIISNSNATKYFLVKKFRISKKKVSVIHNGLKPLNEKQKIINRFSEKISIGYLGRFETQKGIPSLINAAKILKKYNFYFGGYGSWESYIKDLITDQNNIFLVGKINNSNEFLNKIDLLVVPSIREPFGNVIVEAGFSKKAVIASNIDGIPEIIFNNQLGYLIDPKEEIDINFRPNNSLMYPEKVFNPVKKELVKPLQVNPQELAMKIQEVAENKSLRIKLGESLFKSVSNRFSLNKYFESTEKFYFERIK